MTIRDHGLGGSRRHTALALLLAVTGAAALWFVVQKALLYGSFDPGAYDSLWPRRFGLLAHLAGGAIAILAGVGQLWLGLTDRTAGLHRPLGRIYVAAVAVGAVGGLYLALTAGGGFAYQAGLSGLAVAWVVTTGMAVLAIHHRALHQHREWMIRSYIVTFAFITFRIFENLLLNLKVAPPGQVSAFMAFACWAVPLLLAEPLIQFRKIRSR
ncbi:MAG TPA: DUF2306 domain-containing protein [Alphaproteobacteria bacterium]|jgi:uncharacterized membrane protein|nr:DUF2306 domain-containing protein [Alphaproteobacteria bacterium]